MIRRPHMGVIVAAAFAVFLAGCGGSRAHAAKPFSAAGAVCARYDAQLRARGIPPRARAAPTSGRLAIVELRALAALRPPQGASVTFKRFLDERNAEAVLLQQLAARPVAAAARAAGVALVAHARQGDRLATNLGLRACRHSTS
jgi:hypothetical protein